MKTNWINKWILRQTKNFQTWNNECERKHEINFINKSYKWIWWINPKLYFA